MKTFILMSRLASRGPSMVEVVSRVKDGPRNRQQWIGRVKRQCPNVKFVAHYALLGGWDFMDIYKAPDEETAAMVSMICSATDAFRVESWVAIPDERIEELVSKIETGDEC